jgi:hypothetical protein
VFAEVGRSNCVARHAAHEAPAAPLAVVIVLVWRELADFSGYDEKWGRPPLSLAMHRAGASKNPAAI